MRRSLEHASLATDDLTDEALHVEALGPVGQAASTSYSPKTGRARPPVTAHAAPVVHPDSSKSGMPNKNKHITLCLGCAPPRFWLLLYEKM